MRSFLSVSLILFIIVVFSSCHNYKQHLHDMRVDENPTQKIPLKETTNRSFQKSWQRWDLEKSPRLYDYQLRQKETIAGLPCIGIITVDEMGIPYVFLFGASFELNGTKFPLGSRYETILNRKGNRVGYMITLTSPIIIQGFNARHKGSFLEEYHVEFYENGNLRYFKPENDIIIENVPCKGGAKKSDVMLYPDGQLMSCFLAKDNRFGDKPFEKNDRILYNKEGEVHMYSKQLYLNLIEELGLY